MKHDKVVLEILVCEFRNHLKRIKFTDFIWVIVGGTVFLISGLIDLADTLNLLAGSWLQQPAHWWIALTISEAILGLLLESRVTKSAQTVAFSPYLSPLPLSFNARRRMVSVASSSIGILLAGISAASASVVAARLHFPSATATAFASFIIFLLGFSASLLFRLALMRVHASGLRSETRALGTFEVPVPMLKLLDRSTPRWLGTWALSMPAGKLKLTPRIFIWAFILSIAITLSVASSFATHQAAPASITAIGVGLAVFMLTLRCDPLASPVLRSSSQSLASSWLRLLRLPLVASVLAFAVPASAAIAAEPSAWIIPIGAIFPDLILCSMYGVFAAYFVKVPRLAMVIFVIVLAYTGYEYIEYRQPVLAAPVLLTWWLWRLTARRYRNGQF